MRQGAQVGALCQSREEGWGERGREFKRKGTLCIPMVDSG